MATVLVADSVRRTRGMLVDALQRGGFDVIEARDGNEALEAASRQHLDLILLDLVLPAVDGFEVLKS